MSKKKNKSKPNYTLSRLLTRNYGSKEKKARGRILNSLRFEKPRYWWKERSLIQKLLLFLALIFILIISSMYGISRWYIAKHSKEPIRWGVTFIPKYARSFGLNPQETMQALIDDLGIRKFRLVSYWESIEKNPGIYNFEELDWQFKKAQDSDSKISLAIGLRQPRWPECHMPSWADGMTKDEWYPHLKDFMEEVINRYKNNPALESYQLENEYFLKVFGVCKDFSRERLVDEYNFVKKLDPNHKVIISRSNNAIGIPLGEPVPDMYGVSVYKRVWDKTLTKRYVEYPFPAWFYGFLAGAGEIVHGKDMIIHEMQAEPWAPTSTKETSLEEQDKSLNAKRLVDRLQYARGTGMRNIDLWGAEWWYWRKIKLNDSSIWDTARQQIQSDQCPSCYN